MQPDLIHCAVHALVLFEPHRRHKEVIVSEHVLLTETTNDDEVFDLINLWAKGYNSGWDGVM